MKIALKGEQVMLAAENNYDVFCLGQITGQMIKLGIAPSVEIPNEKAFGVPDAKLTMQEKDFISYLIKKI